MLRRFAAIVTRWPTLRTPMHDLANPGQRQPILAGEGSDGFTSCMALPDEFVS